MRRVDENIRYVDSGSAGVSEEAATHLVDGRARTAGQKAVPHFTPAERAARGKAARGELPRSAHAAWEPRPRRRDPVDLLEEQAQTRLPELVPIRYGRMLVSPFTFFRGAAYLMAADLADGPRTGLHAQLCGDAHLSNFGIFAAPDRRLVFSINDFDETLPGPFEWDVKRLAASFAVAGRELGFNDVARRSLVMTTVREYREAMARFAAMRNIERLVRAPRSRGHPPAAGSGGVQEADEAVPDERRARAHEGQPASAREAVSNVSTASCGSSATRPSSRPSRTY